MTDLAVVLAPVTVDAPCGPDLSFSTEFDAIQDARREDDASLDQGEWVTALKTADWHAVVDLCTELLAARSKDIRLGVWLVEALAQRDGVAGLAQGLETLASLCERYWDGLHPLPEDGDQEQRIGNLAWLISRTIDLVRGVPLTSTPGEAYCLNDLESARALQPALDRDPDHADALSAGRVTLARFSTAQRKTPAAFQVRLIEDLESVRTAFARFEQVIDLKLGADSPSFAAARGAIDGLAHAVEIMARENGALATAPDAVAASAVAGEGNDTAWSNANASGSVASRQQALQQLRRVAEFFRRTEPHSPVAYLAERAARWGEMPLHLWLRHVVKDEASLGQLEELLGIERSAPSGDEGA